MHLRLPVILAFAIASVSTALAQTAPVPAPSTAARLPAGDAVQLSVFEVRTDKDTGYAASTALTGTRTSEELQNLPNSISVLTADFLSDIAAFDFFDAADFGVSTENVANDNGTRGAPVGARSGNQLSFRGMPAIRQLRDGFPWYVPIDVFNTERIEFNRGPGGLAYGDVDAGGIVNVGTKRAAFRRATSLQARFDDWGTRRASLDHTQTLVRDRLAMRVNTVYSDRESWRQRGGSKLHGYAAALRWTPTRRTVFDATLEHGRQSDGLTHAVLTDMTAAYVLGTGSNALDANPSLDGVQTHGAGMMRTAAPGNTQVWSLIDGRLYNLESTATAVFRNTFINQGTGAAVVSGVDPQNPARVPYGPAPESIIPRGEDWGGPANFAQQEWIAYTLELKHEIGNRFRLLLAHNGQRDSVRREKSLNDLLQNNSGFGARSLHRDISPNLPNPAGPGLIPNSRYEQFFIHHHQLLNNDGRDVLNFRGVAVYDLELPRGFTQRLVGSVGYRTETNYRDVFAEALTREEIARQGLTGAAALTANNFFYRYHYLRDGNGDDALQNRIVPGVSTFARQDQLGNNARFDQSLTSASVNAIGAYFKRRLHTSVGVSRDRWHQRSARLINDPVTGDRTFVDGVGALIPEGGRIPTFELYRRWVTNQTYGAVWHMLPWVSLSGGYFESAQFADSSGTLLDGRPLPPQTGEGHDYGLRFKLWQDHITLVLTRFKTVGENVSSGVSAAVRDELNPLLREPFFNLNDTRDRTSTGTEAELLFNFGRAWTARLAYSENSVIFTGFFPLVRARLGEARAAAAARGLDATAATLTTADYLEQQEEDARATDRRTANATLRYSFPQGRLNGLSLGLAARYQLLPDRAAIIIGGQQVIPLAEADPVILFNPFATYRVRVGRATWTGQINVNNVFDRVQLMSPTYRFTRYSDPRQIIFTATRAF
jgi:outer membrane receptor protein involved in Fe transport